MPKGLISKERLERNQIPIYAAALLLGAGVGFLSPAAGSALEVAIYPVLGVLLYATFLQVPFSELQSAAASGRFLAATLVLNFLLVPVVVFVLSRFIAAETRRWTTKRSGRRSASAGRWKAPRLFLQVAQTGP